MHLCFFRIPFSFGLRHRVVYRKDFVPKTENFSYFILANKIRKITC